MAVGGTSQQRGGVQAHVTKLRVSILDSGWLPANQRCCGGPSRRCKHRTASSKHVSHRAFAPAFTLLQPLKRCVIATKRTLLATVKMLHWLAGAKQPEGSGKHAPRNIEIVAYTLD